VRRAALLAWIVLLACVPGASARFVAATSPPGFLDSFAASDDAWVTATSGFPLQVFASRDRGDSWQAIPLNGLDTPQALNGLSVGPDRAFYATVRDNNGQALMRMARGATTFERVPAILPSDFQAYAGAPAWDDRGRMWIGVIEMGRLRIARVGADGALTDEASTSVDTNGAPELQFAGGRLYVDIDANVLQLDSGRLRVISGVNTTAFGSHFPVLAAGNAVLTRSGLSVDGGRNFGSRFNAQLIPVHGSDRLLVEREFTNESGGRVLTRWSPTVYRPSGLTVPQGTESMWQTQRGLVAFAAGGNGAVSVHTGGIPAYTVDGRGVRGIARSMIKRANFFRRRAGLPPLLADRLITKASLNHARYWSSRALPRGHLLDVHGETPGTRGFTGRTPTDRCKHVGGECGGEVMNFGNQAQTPVDSWVSTPYHREPFIDPSNTTAGAARVGRIAVMNFQRGPENVVLGPVRFPLGRYSGTLRFAGNEAPDPIAACRAAHQSLGPNPSVPVSFVPPVGVSKQAVVRLFRGGRAVPGCTRVGFFMGRSPLRPHTRYTAKATWQAAEGGSPITTVWTFRTA